MFWNILINWNLRLIKICILNNKEFNFLFELLYNDMIWGLMNFIEFLILDNFVLFKLKILYISLREYISIKGWFLNGN